MKLLSLTSFNSLPESLRRRGLTLPDSAEAGKRTGEYIKAKAKSDHGQLLYAIVDAAVRHVGTRPAAN
jgi:hypothetical protein